MKNIKYILFLIILISPVLISQNQQEYITITGDTFFGRVENEEKVREVIGNVVLRQGDVVITCNKAIQFLERNNAHLIGNVVARQKNVTIYTSEGFYFGNDKKAVSNTGVKLDDKKVILTAKTGEYLFDKEEAFFQNDVKLYDTATTLTSKYLRYYKTIDKALAVGDVKIVDSENLIQSDTVIHFRDTKVTFAVNNVKISNLKNNSVIYGNRCENYRLKKYSIVKGDTRLIQIDTSDVKASDSSGTAQIDTLLMSSIQMEAFQDTSNIFIATDSVKMVRGSFASKNEFTFYDRTKQEIITKKMKKTAPVPIIWYEFSQLTGDSIKIVLDSNKIKQMYVNNNAFILSQNAIYKKRFDQIAGSKVVMFFNDNELKKTDVSGSVYSIYYTYDSDEPNGLTKSSSQTASIIFENKKVDQVKLYGTPVSEYYPESLVEGKEQSFTLPGYVFYANRPTKELILETITNKKFN